MENTLGKNCSRARWLLTVLPALAVVLLLPHTSFAQSTPFDGSQTSPKDETSVKQDKPNATDETSTSSKTDNKTRSGKSVVVGYHTTTLLFPFVSAQAGFDTGIAISNTSRDTVGTAPQAGTCTLNYFGNVTGGGGPPPPQTTNAPVPAGEQLLFTLSTGGNFGIAGRPGFQGYIIATCNFQYAHGYALITDGPIGQARIGSSYLALIIPAGKRNPNGEKLDQ
jgi:hypothetical protein